jgi:predicted metalloprotease
MVGSPVENLASEENDMRWTPGQRSGNLEDRRGEGGGGFSFGGRPGGMKLGCGGIFILLILSIVFKQDFFQLLDPGAGGGGGYTAPADNSAPPQTTAEEENQVDFISFVLDDVQGTWGQTFPALGESYNPAKLVLFREAVRTGCGIGEAAAGPFYCPGDNKVYIDLSFYDELDRRFGAPGDFAQAYVLAHEIGHHVQNELGIERQVRNAMQQRPSAANQLSVALELQADCFAGIWAHSAAKRNKLDPGDIEEGLNAASAVGDDRIQQRATGYVNPDSFTHGSAAERARWFRRGYENGDVKACDTFGG